MIRTSIIACLDPRNAFWELGPLPTQVGGFTLIGWSVIPPPVDNGIPENVAAVLSRTLTSIAQVTFPLSAEGYPWWWRRWFGTRSVTTRSPKTTLRLFEDGGHPWWLRGQVVLLSTINVAPREFKLGTLRALIIHDNWAERAAPLAADGVLGVLRPGVDGEVAGLLTFDERFKQTFLTALERETRSAGFEWAVLSEEGFTNYRAGDRE